MVITPSLSLFNFMNIVLSPIMCLEHLLSTHHWFPWSWAYRVSSHSFVFDYAWFSLHTSFCFHGLVNEWLLFLSWGTTMSLHLQFLALFSKLWHTNHSISWFRTSTQFGFIYVGPCNYFGWVFTLSNLQLAALWPKLLQDQKLPRNRVWYLLVSLLSKSSF